MLAGTQAGAWELTTADPISIGTTSLTFGSGTGSIQLEDVTAATDGNLTADYDSGDQTLTNSDTQAALKIDDVDLVARNRVLVKNQTDATQNGIYVVTETGSGTENWVLTRSADFVSVDLVLGDRVCIFSGFFVPLDRFVGILFNPVPILIHPSESSLGITVAKFSC